MVGWELQLIRLIARTVSLRGHLTFFMILTIDALLGRPDTNHQRRSKLLDIIIPPFT